MTLFTEKDDLIAIFERMEQEASVDKDHIFLFGASQGGLISAMAAEEYKEKIAGMILLYPALCIADNWRERFASEDDIPKELDFWGMQLGDVFFKSDPFDQFHYNVIDAVVISYIKYIYNIWMCKTSCCLGFTSEFLYKSCIFPEFRLQNLNCHKTV